MKTYLVVCGIILNGLVLLAIVGIIISAICASIDKKRNKITQYKEELRRAKYLWQEWLSKKRWLSEKESNEFELKRTYYFQSSCQFVLLSTLAKQYDWVRK